MLGSETRRVKTPLRLRQFYLLDGITLPLRYPVRVIWDGRGPFEAARVKNPRTGAASWITHDENGDAVVLPCRKRRPKDGDAPWKGPHTFKSAQPDYWAPVDPDKFKLFRLPPVAITLPEEGEPPRMWNARQSFKAVDAAVAAEEQRVERKRGQKRQLWWLDVAKIRYAAPGKITRDDAEGRIMRALAQEPLDFGVVGLGMHRRRGLTDDQLRELAEAEAKELPSILPRFEAVQPDADDYDTAMAWFAALGARELFPSLASKAGGGRLGKDTSHTTAQWVLLFASRDSALSYRRIASNLKIVEGRKISAVRVHQIHKIALEGIWIIANEFKDVGSAKRADALERLKEGNRRARGQT
jgi:hypothetical protein